MKLLKLLCITIITIFILMPIVPGEVMAEKRNIPGVNSDLNSDVHRLVGALLQETPIMEDLRQLCDEIGGRPTGSKANLQAVEWAIKTFKDAGVTVKKESFTMPGMWLERSAEATVSGDVSFRAEVAAMPFSIDTPETGLKAPLVDLGYGTEADFKRVGQKVKGAFILVETKILHDVGGIFYEYTNAAAVENRAAAAGAAGVLYMSSRPTGLLYRHNASPATKNKLVMLIMRQEHARRAFRLMRAGKQLNLTVKLDIQTSGPYESYNVIGEIPGTEKPGEYVVIGAHLDSWGLGTGAIDNGCNVVMMIDIARQMKRLGIKPKRTIRFALWNGEEQGMIGSWAYTRQHLEEMDGHVMSCSIDTGDGRIKGFFTNGRAEIIGPVNAALEPVKGLGPFHQINIPLVGTDNYDFMLQGIANLMTNHEPEDYALHYHAGTDTFDKVAPSQLKLNAAITAALAYGFADMEVNWKRQTRAEIQKLIDSTNLGDQMKIFGSYDDWVNGKRGRK